MARDIRVTVVLNRIELIRAAKLCAKYNIKRSTLLRQILTDFLDLSPDEQTKRIQRGEALAAARSKRRSKPAPLPASRSRSDNRHPGPKAKSPDQGGEAGGHPHLQK